MSAVPTDLRASIKAGEIEVSHVSKSYGDSTFLTEVVRDCSFKIERNKLTVMIGPSGCGKSTLIRLLAGFEAPDSGSITINGQPVTGPARDRLVLFQESALFPWMNTWDNVMYGLDLQGKLAKAERVEHLIAGLRWCRRHDGVAAIVGAQWTFPLRLVLREVRRANRIAASIEHRHYTLRRRAFVVSPASVFRDSSQAGGQLGILQHVAGDERLAAREVQRERLRVRTHPVLGAGDESGEDLSDRESFFRDSDSGGEHLIPRECAILLVQGQ